MNLLKKIVEGDLHPCWKKVPQRPLNGRRDVGLILNSYDGSTFGSHVNFTCNPFFELTGGMVRIFCNNGRWNESAIPKCLRSKSVCTVLPPNRTESSIMLLANGYTFLDETDVANKKIVRIYTTVSYVCANSSLRFADPSRRIGLKMRNNSTQQFYSYQNATCLGQNRWQPLPRCL